MLAREVGNQMKLWDDFKTWAFGTEDLGQFGSVYADELSRTVSGATAQGKEFAATSFDRSLSLAVEPVKMLGRGLDSISLKVFGTTNLDDFATNFVDEARAETGKVANKVADFTVEKTGNAVSRVLGGVPATAWIVGGAVLLIFILVYTGAFRKFLR